MLGANLSVHFYLKKQKGYKSGPQPIYLRITMDKQVVELSISRKCEPRVWDRRSERPFGKTLEVRELVHHINTFEMKVFEARISLIEKNKQLSAEALKNNLLGKEICNITVLDVFRQHNERMAALVGKEFADGTMERYETSIKHTASFIFWKYKVKDLPLTNLNFEFISSYEFWLKTERKCQHNTAMKYLSNFKKITNHCVRAGWIIKDPFVQFKMSKREVIREPLSIYELQSLIDKKFNIERLELVKDIFVFCCYTGLAYADVHKLKKSEITKGVDGKQWILTNRQKTDTASRIPLLPVALSLIEKYKEHPACVQKDRLLPVLSNQKMNAYLKEVADLCGINRNLTFHIARHTFATTVTLGNDVPIESVSKMLGHKNLKTTQHYAKILDLKVSNDMAALKIKLDNNNF